jgi:GNAT superfamily N-acetyltransferase
MPLVEIGADGEPALASSPLTGTARDVCAMHIDVYRAGGFVRPWVGYLHLRDGAWVGAGSFKRPPRDGVVEIAYFTFPEWEGRGVATATATELLRIARAATPVPRITARTLREPNASTRILTTLGFRLVGTVEDPDDGRVWEWEAPVRPGAVLRRATRADVPALEALIARSARTLGAADYGPGQIEGALRGAFGVDTQLIDDGTYFVAEEDGRLVACGGWSRRRTLFGGDARPDRDDGLLDPAVDAARVRAFFVDPDHARRGLGRAILERCETEARVAGFTRLALMATLPGVRLYAAHGWVAEPRIEHPVGDGVTIGFVPMTKTCP